MNLFELLMIKFKVGDNEICIFLAEYNPIASDWLYFVTTPSRGELVRYGVVVNKLKFDESDWLQFLPHGFPPSRGELCICISCFDWWLFLPHKFPICT